MVYYIILIIGNNFSIMKSEITEFLKFYPIFKLSESFPEKLKWQSDQLINAYILNYTLFIYIHMKIFLILQINNEM